MDNEKLVHWVCSGSFSMRAAYFTEADMVFLNKNTASFLSSSVSENQNLETFRSINITTKQTHLKRSSSWAI